MLSETVKGKDASCITRRLTTAILILEIVTDPKCETSYDTMLLRWQDQNIEPSIVISLREDNATMPTVEVGSSYFIIVTVTICSVPRKYMIFLPVNLEHVY